MDDWAKFFDLARGDEACLNALQRICVCRAQIAALFMLGLRQHYHAARAEHDVIVQILAQGFIKAARFLIDRGRRILEIVRANDRGIAPRVPAAKPALFNHGQIGDAKILTQVIGRSQTMAACANDDRVILGLWCWVAPRAFPTLVISQCLFDDGKDRIVAHGERHS